MYIRKLLARIFVMGCYLLTAIGLPFYGVVNFVLWMESINIHKLIVAVNSIGIGFILGFWILLVFGIFSYAVSEEE